MRSVGTNVLCVVCARVCLCLSAGHDRTPCKYLFGKWDVVRTGHQLCSVGVTDETHDLVAFVTRERVLFEGETARRRSDSLSGNEALFRRVQVSEVQEKVEVWQQLGKRRSGLYQVQDRGLS